MNDSIKIKCHECNVDCTMVVPSERKWKTRRGVDYFLQASSEIRVPTCPECGEFYLSGLDCDLIEQEVNKQVAQAEKDHVNSLVNTLLECGATEDGLSGFVGIHPVFFRKVRQGKKMLSMGELTLLEILAADPNIYFTNVEKYGRQSVKAD